ncbi:helix-turn-helix transcriptional regulator [Rothia sp. 27098_8_27]|uniref:helix-turn-helix transcriptional regulator n=1 Tax=Rothia sp. 27098_8_27 TaxID=3003677 RepID=UPI00352FE348
MTTSPNLGQHGKLYDIPAIAAATGYTRANIYHALGAQNFPAPAVTYNRGKGLEEGRLWREEDILAWAGLSLSQKMRGEGSSVPDVVRIEDYATGDGSGLIVCTITGGADGFLSAVKSAEYSQDGLTREEATEVALKTVQRAYRGDA